MRAAVLKGPEKIEIEEKPFPELHEDEVLIEVKYCGICGSDLEIFKTGIFTLSTPIGYHQLTEAEGMVLGHEFTGVVREKGSEVQAWEEEDRVVVNPGAKCGECYWCENGQFNLCPQTLRKGIGVGSPGAFADYVVVKDYMPRKLPEDLSFKEGALTEPFSTPIHATKTSNIGIGGCVEIL